jgi:aspartate aminotransferase
MVQFASRVESVSISAIRELFEVAGPDSINLGIGQPDFPTPAHVRAAARAAIDAGEVDAYTPNNGQLATRQAIAAKSRRDQGVPVEPDRIILTAGGSEALHIAIMAHVSPGDEVLIPDPGFVSYDALVRLAGGTPVPVPLREDLTLDPAAVAAAMTDDTVAFIINSPGNPTGAVSPPADIDAFAALAAETETLCISDEVYEYTVFDGTFRSALEGDAAEHVVVVNSASKLFSMTGWRIGWVIATPDRVTRMLRVHQYAQACATAVSQVALRAALEGPQDIVTEMTTTFARRRDVVVDRLEAMGLSVPTPGGAFYAMPRVPDGFAQACIEHDVLVVPGDAFGAAGADRVRISFATDMDTLEEGLDRMQTALASL